MLSRARDTHAILPLIDNQKELWLAHNGLPKEHPGILCGGNFSIRGELDAKRFQRALAASVVTDELLTATLHMDAGGTESTGEEDRYPHFLLNRHPDPDYHFLDLRRFQDPAAQATLKKRAFIESPFQPLGGPLCRFLLLRLEDRHYWFLSCYFHLALDGINLQAHYNRIARYYTALSQEGRIDREPSSSWTEEIAAYASYKASPRFARDLAYWRDKMNGIDASFHISPLPGRPDEIGPIARLEWDLPRQPLRAFLAWARAEKATPMAALLALHYLTLARGLDRRRLVIQVPLRFGAVKEEKRMTGYTVNVIPLEIAVNPESSFEELTAAVSRELMGALRRVRCPWQLGWRMAAHPNAMGRHPRASWTYIPLPAAHPGNAHTEQVVPITSAHDPTVVGIYLVQGDEQDDIHLSIDYSRNHFTEDLLRRHCQRYGRLMEQITQSPGRAVGDLDFLLPEERQRLEVCAAGESRAFEDGCIPEIFARCAARHGERTAVIGGTKELRYAELSRQVNGLALLLRSLGVSRGDAVAVVGRRHPGLPVAMLGVMQAGGVYVPITPDNPPSRMATIIEAVGAKVVVVLQAEDAALVPKGVHPIRIDAVPPAERSVPLPNSPEDTAYIIFTSGSTGRPKGVRVPHRAFVNMAQHQIAFLGLTPADRVLQFASPSFDASLSEVFMALFSGAALLPVSRAWIDEPWRLREEMMRQGVTVVTFPPSYLRLFNHAEFPGLRVLLTAGEAPHPADVAFYASRLDYINAYGPTEAAVCASMRRIPPQEATAPITIGRPTVNTQINILDSRLQLLPPGFPGEICIGGIGLAQGYLEPTQTAVGFVESANTGMGRLYRTGDMGLWTDQGDLLLLGRRDNQIKIRGHRVELGEIEFHLDQCPGVLQSVACVLKKGEEDGTLTAFYVPADKQNPPENAALREQLKDRLPAYMIPSRLVLLDALPITSSGKIDRRRLTLLEAPARENAVARKADGAVQARIRSVLKKVFGEAAADLDDETDLYALGVDSIKLMQAAHLLSSEFGVTLALRDLRQAANLQDLTAQVEAQAAGQAARQRPALRAPAEPLTLPLTEAQRQLWAIAQMDEAPALYHMPLLLEIEASSADEARFIQALEEAVAAQPSFRLGFEADAAGENPLARVHAAPGFTVEQLDFCQEDKPVAAALSALHQRIHLPFDLGVPPLIRAALARITTDRCLFMLCLHHIVGDGASLFGLIEQTLAGLEGQAPAQISAALLADIAADEAQYLSSPAAADDRDYWLALLTPAPPRLSLFGAKARPAVRKGQGDHLHRELDMPLLAAIQALATQTKTTPLGVWVSMVQGYLARGTGQDDIAIGVPVGTRTRPEWNGIAGYFVNTVVIRTDGWQSLPPLESIRRTGRALQAALRHSRYPFPRLASELGVTRDASRAAIIDVLATWSDELPSCFERAGLTLRPWRARLETAKFDAVFLLRLPANGTPEVVLEYDTALAERAEAESLLSGFMDFLRFAALGAAVPTIEPVAQHSPLPQNQEPTTAPADNEAVQQALGEAWKAVLGGQSAGPEADFFESGGDSLKAIRIVARLRERGLTLRPADLFAQPRFADLVAYLASGERVVKTHIDGFVKKPRIVTPAKAGVQNCSKSLDPRLRGDDVNGPSETFYEFISTPQDQNAPSGPVVLTPIQRWMFARHPDHWSRFFMAAGLRLRQKLDEALLQGALNALIQRHEALRTVYGGPGPAAWVIPPHAGPWLTLTAPPDSTAEMLLPQAVDALIEQIAPGRGQLFGAALIRATDGDILLLAGHHLALDGVSFSVLAEELKRFIAEGRLPEGTDPGPSAWAARLAAYSAGPGAAAEKNRWQSLMARTSRMLPLLKAPRPADRIGQRRTHDLALNRETLATLTERAGRRRYGLQGLLLAALGEALACRLGEGEILLLLEGHGRSLNIAGAEAGSGVGWYTAPYPFFLPLRGASEAPWPAVEDLIEALPNAGAAFGELYPLAELPAPWRPWIAFNFLPFQEAQDAAAPFTLFDPRPLLPGGMAGLVHPDLEADQPLEATVITDAQGLRLSLSHHPSLLDEAWVASLLKDWGARLGRSPDEEAQERGKDLAARIGCLPGEIEAIYPLTATQEGMFFQHALEGGAAGSYTEQIRFRIRGHLDAKLLAEAWQDVVQRHQGLRARFVATPRGQVVQAILRRADTCIETVDLSARPPGKRKIQVVRLLEPWRDNAFDLARGPLFCLQAIRIGANETLLSWSCHHILIDGWCIGLLWRDLFTAYRARRDARPAWTGPAPTLDTYFRRLGRTDTAAARNWWRGALDGFSRGTPLNPAEASTDRNDPRYFELLLDSEATAGLRNRARHWGVSLPCLMQSAWAALLGGRGGWRDVVFGLVTLGRPPETPGLDETVGNFLHTLPVRVAFQATDAVGMVAKRIQASAFEREPHETFPLPDILALTPLGHALFDHLLDFHPLTMNDVRDDLDPSIIEVTGFERIPYDFCLNVVGGDQVTLRLLYNANRYTRAQVAKIAAQLRTMLDRIVAEEAIRMGDLIPVPVARAGRPADRAGVSAAAAHPAIPPACSAAPNPALIREVAALFEEVLQTHNVKSTDDFFALGGHSLTALRLLLKLEARLGCKVEPRDFSAAATVEGLSALATRTRSAATIEAAAPIAVHPAQAHPLAFIQERLWFLQMMAPEAGIYNTFHALRLKGPLNTGALERALADLLNRHAALHIRVPDGLPAGGALTQRFAEPAPFHLECVDLSKAQAPATACREILGARIRKPFRFGWDQALTRFVLYCLGTDDHVLGMVFHHLILDGWSAGILQEELAEAYAAELVGRAPRLPELTLGYADYVTRQRATLASAEGAAMARRWQARFTPLPEPLNLPMDYARPMQRGHLGGIVRRELDPLLAQAATRFATARSVTLFSVLLAGVKVLLAKLTGAEDIVVGTPVAGRHLPDHPHGLDKVVGCFVNTVVLRDRVAGAGNFEALVRSVGETVLDAIEDQIYPFEMLVDALQVPRDPSRNPLFDVLVAIQDGTPWDPRFAGVAASTFPLVFGFSKFDLSFYFSAGRQGITLEMEYAADLFTAASGETLVDRFCALLGRLLANPTLALSSHGILIDGEAEQVLRAFNRTAWDHPVEGTIGQAFAAAADAHPGAVALRFDTGSLRYDDLLKNARRVASALRQQGIQAGRYVMVCCDRSPELMAAIYGIQLAGGVYVPIDPATPAARIGSMIEDIGDCLALTDPGGAQLLSGLPVAIIDIAECLRTRTAWVDMALGCPPAGPDDVAYAIFTSGSTGRPKGVAVEHRGLLNRLHWTQRTFQLTGDDVLLLKTSISFDVSIWELFWWGMTGASLALLAQGAEREPGRIIDAVERHGVTVMHFVPSMLGMFLDYVENRPEAIRRLRCLRAVIASGEALPPDMVNRFNRLLHQGIGTELFNLYGPTEATVDVTWHPCSPGPAGSLVPIGRPVDNTAIYIVDETLQPLPVGVRGEIMIGGVQVARGYINRPDLNRAKFIPDPFRPGGRMYRTGDYGIWRADGTVVYLGRMDNQVKLRGFRIELGEIETALERIAGISRAVVVVSSSDGLDRLDAYLLPEAGTTPEPAVLRAVMAKTLPEYMLPGRFFVLRSLPLTGSGKVNRRALGGEPLGVQRLAPEAMTEVQRRILAIWQRILTDSPIGLHETFFEAGGDSLRLIRLHEHLEREWPGRFRLAELFNLATVADQAAVVAPSAQGPLAAVRVPTGVNAGEPIAVIGMALRLADFEDPQSFWKDLLAGADRVREIPPSRRMDIKGMLTALNYPVNGFGLRPAAYLDDIAGFDAARFRLAPADAAIMDPEQRLFLETALHALEEGGYGGNALVGARVGAFVGASPQAVFRDAVAASFPDLLERNFVLNVPSNLATRLGYLKNWHGPAAMVDTACSSSLNAVHLACRALRRGDCDLALAGGVKVMHLPLMRGQGFTIDASDGRTHAFDASADGTGGGEGAVAFLLKPLSRAELDRDAIHAVILGSAVNQDGRSTGMAAPNPAAQTAVIRQAAADAGIALDVIGFLEAHGTGTALGDPVEIEGITQAFPPRNGHPAAIGSVKGNYGHLDAAAGALSLAKAIVCLEQGCFPRQPFYQEPNPRIDFSRAPVFVPRTTHLLGSNGKARHGGVSSFGLSGVNVHAIVRGAPPKTARVDQRPGWYCIPLSVAGNGALAIYADKLARTLGAHPEYDLDQVAATLTQGRDHLNQRAALWADTQETLRRRLVQLATAANPAAIEAGLLIGSPTARVEALEIALGRFEDEAGAMAAAAAFIAGARPIWKSPDGEKSPGRVHLPPAPYHRVRCWPAFDQAKARREPAGPTTGLLGSPLTTASGRYFPVPAHDNAFWPVADHWIGGEPTLVGMAWPALLAEALGTDSAEVVTVLDNLTWLRPLRPGDLEQGTVSFGLPDNRDGSRTKLRGHTRAGTWEVFAEASVSRKALPEKRMDLEMLRAGMQPIQPIESQAGQDEGRMVRAGQRWACRRQVWGSEDGTRHLATLTLPEAFRGELKAIPFHPALLDVAASLALDREGFVPAACRRMTLYGRLGAHLTAFSTTLLANDTGIRSSCLILDEQGRVLVEMEDLFFRRAKSSGISLHGLAWETQTPLPQALTCDPAAVLVVGAGPRADACQRALAEQGSTRPCLAFPLDTKATDEVLRYLATGKVARLLLFAPQADATGWQAASFLKALLHQGLKGALTVIVAGAGAFAPSGDHGEIVPQAALTAGLVTAAAWEEPLLTIRYVDLDDATDGRVLLPESEIRGDGPRQPAVRYLKNERLVRRFVEKQTAEPTAPDLADGVFVLTGGLGAMGLTLAKALAARGARKLALIQRGSFPSDEAWPALAAGDDPVAAFQAQGLLELRAEGAQVSLHACDVGDPASLGRVLETIRRDQGAIRGVVHAAGVAGGGFLLRKERAAWERVLRPKIDGTRHLHALTLQDPLAFFVLAASRTGLTGAPGQTDYAAANAYLDSFALWRRAQGLPALAIDWATWNAIGMAAVSGADREASDTVAPEDAAHIFFSALASGLPQVAVVGRKKSLPSVAQEPAEVPLPTAATGLVAPTLETIGAIWRMILGYDRVLEGQEDFFELGGDSLTGMQVVSRVQSDTGRTVSLADLFSHGTLNEFIKVLGTLATPAAAPAAAPPADFPVMREQLGILQESGMYDTGTAYNLPVFLSLPETISRERLEAAMIRLIERHTILRACFVLEGDEPRMRVLPSISFHLTEERRDQLDIAALSRELIQPFDLSRAPLFRARWIGFENGPPLFYFDIHHAVADAFSLDLLLGDLAALYDDRPLPPLTHQLKEIAQERCSPEGEARDVEARRYWLNRFSGELPKLDLPADFPRPARHTYRGDTVQFSIDADLTDRVRQTARRFGTTTFNLFLAAWALLIHRATGEREPVIACALNERDRPDLRLTPGMLIALLPLKLTVDGKDRLDDLIRSTHLLMGEAMRHRGYNLTRLLAELAPGPTPERTALREVTFSYMKGMGQGLAGLWSGVANLAPAKASSKADIAIFGTETDEGVYFLLEYYRDLFRAERVERMGRRLVAIVRAMVDLEPAALVCAIRPMDEDEHALLQSFTGTMVALPADVAVHGLVAAQAAQRPEATAVMDAKGELTYYQMVQRASAMAASLLAAGLTPGGFVALDAAKEARTAAFLLAILKAGGAYLPLDADQPAARSAAMLGDAACSFLITNQRPLAALAPPGCQVLDPDALWAAPTPGAAIFPALLPDSPAYVIYTSGSTGAPKGVVVPHRAIYRLVKMSPTVQLGPEDCVLQGGSIAFDASTWEIWGPLANGARVVFVDKAELLEEGALGRLIQRYGVTVLWLTSSLCNRYAEEDPACFAPLRCLLTGGEALSVRHIQRIRDACPGLTIVNGYGPTENTTFTTTHAIGDADLALTAIPIGRPVGNTLVKILDKYDDPAPIGVWGEICTGGDGLALGYWHDPELTAQRFIEDPARPGERLYRTGDYGRWSESGVVEFLGRRDDQFKLRGFRIEPAEIEETMRRAPGVRQAAAVVHAGKDGAPGLIGCVVVDDDFAPDQLMAVLRRDLPGYMLPGRFLKVDEIPLTPNGKTDRRKLRALIDTDQAMPLYNRSVGVLKDEQEELIAALFCDLLGVAAVGPESNFLELGGHSLMLFRLINRIAEQTGKRLSIREAMSRPRVRELAALLKTARQDEATIPPAPISAGYPLSHAQQRLYVEHQMEGAACAYNMPILFEFGRTFAPDFFQQAVQTICARHETLRTGFLDHNGELTQTIQAQVTVPFALDDLRDHLDARREAYRRIRADYTQAFLLAEPPLLRIRICQTAADTFLCAITMHHIIGDGWSLRVFFAEIAEVYAALERKAAATLPPLAIQYRDYAVWQQGRDWTEAKAYWRTRLAGAPARIDLPFDFPVPKRRSYRGATVQLELVRDLPTALKAAARSRGITVAALGLSIFAALLYRLTRQEDLVIGLGVAGREREELEGLIGFFVNILPIRVAMDEETNLEDLFGMVNEAVQAALHRQDYPFDLLIRDAAPRRAKGRDCLVNVVFEYQRFEGVRSLTALPEALRTRPLDEAAQAAVQPATAKYDLTLFMIEEQGQCLLRAEFDADVLEAGRVRGWLETLAGLFARVCAPVGEEVEA